MTLPKSIQIREPAGWLRGHLDQAAVAGMRKREPSGMEHEPVGRWIMRYPVEPVSDDRHAEPGQMDAKLMGAAGDGLQFQP